MVKLNRVFSAMLVVALVLAMAVLLLPVGEAKAIDPPCDVYVNGTTGNDGWDGTSPVHAGGTVGPKKTILAGISVVCPGGTVHIAAGTYDQGSQMDISKSLTLQGAGVDKTFIDGGGTHRVLDFYASSTLSFFVSDMTIQNGYAEGHSGGIFANYGTALTLTNCTIKNNQGADGGGIHNHEMLIMNGCTVSGNIASWAGGGIFNCGVDSTMELTNCTISGNQIISDANGTRGAGIVNNGTMTLTNCTVANNTTTDPDCVGGGFWNNGHATFLNTIVANNRDGEGLCNNGCDVSVLTINSLGHNLCGDNSCHFDDPTDLVNIDPLLGPLQDNGGPTFTHALLNGSPAIDAGTCTGAPATDQRGVTRPQGGDCDIGAFELEYQIVVPPPSGPGSSPPIQTPPRPLNPSQLSAQYVSISPQQTYANQPVTITTNVVNTGDEAGNLNVVLKINGLVEQSRMVGVGPQGTQPVKFTVARAQPGTYTVDILGEQGSFTVLGHGGTAPAPQNAGLIAIVIIAVLVLTAAVVLTLTFR